MRVVMVHQAQEDGEPPAKRAAPSILVGGGFKWNLQMLAAAADAVESGGKSPVSALNELGVRVAYCVLRQGGPAHCPSFHVAVTVADMRFEGWGHSKREARAAAARSCLAALLARAGRVLPSPAPRDFTSDELGDPTPTLPERAPEYTSPEPVVKAAAAPPPAPPAVVSEGAGLFGAAPASPHKSPINVLYESYSGLTFTCTFGDGSPLTETQAPLQLSHSMRFKVVCQIKEHKFEGYGSSKKLAKLAAARSALAVLEDSREDAIPAAIPHGGLHQTLADHIGKLVNEKFNELMKNELVHAKRKVLAGVVITTHSRIEDARVIAVTTGTKCVSGEHMSVSGRAVNDCHAEVAARRCLQRHLYAQLLQYASQPDPRQPLEDNDLEPLPGGGYQLKPSRQVHLYVSTAPCGDGRIFSPHEHHHEPDKHPNRLARGQLRTKIESGEGTIPVKNCNNVLQTWDGVMQGERLLTMSCSDKVARWCVCGLQGALLSRLLRPVYLTSLVLGSLLHPHHMYRAICGRIEAYLSSLPPPFHLARPLLSRAASTEARTPARAPSFSVCWSSTAPLPEVLNASTGKLDSGQPSLLCKQSMFARWHYLVRRLPLLPQDAEMEGTIPEMPENPDTLLYNEAKQMCPTYQLAKQRLIEAFEKAKLGRWIKRPLEQDQFVCEITDAEPALLFAWAGEQRAARGGRPHAAASAADCDSVATTDSAREDVLHTTSKERGMLGTRTLSYYNYRNKINAPKTNISISSRLIKARVSDCHVSLNRNVVDLNCSPRVGDSCDGREQSENDEWDDDAEIHSSLNEPCVTDRKHDLTAKAAESDQSQHVHVDNDIKDITHKIKDVSLDEKQRLWSEFYKNRNKRVGRDYTKDSTTELDNISETLLQQFDTINSCSLRLNTRDSIRPHGLGTKDNLADESIVLEERSVDDACLVSGRHRDKTVGTSVDSTDTVKDKHLETLREPREVRFNNNVSVESIRGERHGKENTDSIIRKPNIMNKLAAYYASKYRAEGNVMRVTPRGDTLAFTDVPTAAESDDYFFNKCNVDAHSASDCNGFNIDSNKSVLQESNGAQQSVKRSLLLRRLHIYEKICTKNK